jgi:uncharacterized RDD family membrane protein YckC
LTIDIRSDLPPHSYATFWQRAAGIACDSMLFWPIMFAVKHLQPGPALCISLLMTPLSWVYEVGTVVRWGQTFGKMLVGIQIMRTDFTRVSWGRALLRAAGSIAFGGLFFFYELRLLNSVPREIIEAIPFEDVTLFALHFPPNQDVMLFFWPLIAWQVAELVTMLFHPKRRAIHDLIAGTVVVQTSSAEVQTKAHGACRTAPILVAWMVGGIPDTRSHPPSYRSYFADGAVKGEYDPWSEGTTKVVVYWPNGAVRHVLVQSSAKNSKSGRIDATWQSFDETGALTRDVRP